MDSVPSAPSNRVRGLDTGGLGGEEFVHTLAQYTRSYGDRLLNSTRMFTLSVDALRYLNARLRELERKERTLGKRFWEMFLDPKGRVIKSKSKARKERKRSKGPDRVVPVEEVIAEEQNVALYRDLGDLYYFFPRLTSLRVDGGSPTTPDIGDLPGIELDLTFFPRLKVLTVMNCNVLIMIGDCALERIIAENVVMDIREFPNVKDLEVKRGHGFIFRALTEIGMFPWLQSVRLHFASESLAKTCSEVYDEIQMGSESSDDVVATPAWKRIRLLDLSYNEIPRIGNMLGMLAKCESLSLAHNNITVLRSLAMCKKLIDFNCSFNHISSLDGISSMLPSVRLLNLRHNEIRTLAGIERMVLLLELNIADNYIESLDELDRLTPLVRLRKLNVSNNPVTRLKHYRVHVFRALKANDGLRLDRSVKSTAEEVELHRYAAQLKKQQAQAAASAALQSSRSTDGSCSASSHRGESDGPAPDTHIGAEYSSVGSAASRDSLLLRPAPEPKPKGSAPAPKTATIEHVPPYMRPEALQSPAQAPAATVETKATEELRRPSLSVNTTADAADENSRSKPDLRVDTSVSDGSPFSRNAANAVVHVGTSRTDTKQRVAPTPAVAPTVTSDTKPPLATRQPSADRVGRPPATIPAAASAAPPAPARTTPATEVRSSTPGGPPPAAPTAAMKSPQRNKPAKPKGEPAKQSGSMRTKSKRKKRVIKFTDAGDGSSTAPVKSSDQSPRGRGATSRAGGRDAVATDSAVTPRVRDVGVSQETPAATESGKADGDSEPPLSSRTESYREHLKALRDGTGKSWLSVLNEMTPEAPAPDAEEPELQDIPASIETQEAPDAEAEAETGTVTEEVAVSEDSIPIDTRAASPPAPPAVSMGTDRATRIDTAAAPEEAPRPTAAHTPPHPVGGSGADGVRSYESLDSANSRTSETIVEKTGTLVHRRPTADDTPPPVEDPSESTREDAEVMRIAAEMNSMELPESASAKPAGSGDGVAVPMRAMRGSPGSQLTAGQSRHIASLMNALQSRLRHYSSLNERNVCVHEIRDFDTGNVFLAVSQERKVVNLDSLFAAVTEFRVGVSDWTDDDIDAFFVSLFRPLSQFYFSSASPACSIRFRRSSAPNSAGNSRRSSMVGPGGVDTGAAPSTPKGSQGTRVLQFQDDGIRSPVESSESDLSSLVDFVFDNPTVDWASMGPPINVQYIVQDRLSTSKLLDVLQRKMDVVRTPEGTPVKSAPVTSEAALDAYISKRNQLRSLLSGIWKHSNIDIECFKEIPLNPTSCEYMNVFSTLNMRAYIIDDEVDISLGLLHGRDRGRKSGWRSAQHAWHTAIGTGDLKSTSLCDADDLLNTYRSFYLNGEIDCQRALETVREIRVAFGGTALNRGLDELLADVRSLQQARHLPYVFKRHGVSVKDPDFYRQFATLRVPKDHLEMYCQVEIFDTDGGEDNGRHRSSSRAGLLGMSNGVGAGGSGGESEQESLRGMFYVNLLMSPGAVAANDAAKASKRSSRPHVRSQRRSLDRQGSSSALQPVEVSAAICVTNYRVYVLQDCNYVSPVRTAQAPERAFVVLGSFLLEELIRVYFGYCDLSLRLEFSVLEKHPSFSGQFLRQCVYYTAVTRDRQLTHEIARTCAVALMGRKSMVQNKLESMRGPKGSSPLKARRQSGAVGTHASKVLSSAIEAYRGGEQSYTLTSDAYLKSSQDRIDCEVFQSLQQLYMQFRKEILVKEESPIKGYFMLFEELRADIHTHAHSAGANGTAPVTSDTGSSAVAAPLFYPACLSSSRLLARSLIITEDRLYLLNEDVASSPLFQRNGRELLTRAPDLQATYFHVIDKRLLTDVNRVVIHPQMPLIFTICFEDDDDSLGETPVSSHLGSANVSPIRPAMGTTAQQSAYGMGAGGEDESVDYSLFRKSWTLLASNMDERNLLFEVLSRAWKHLYYIDLDIEGGTNGGSWTVSASPAQADGSESGYGEADDDPVWQ